MNDVIDLPALLAASRILVIDDNQAIHQDFRKIFGATRERSMPSAAELALLGGSSVPSGIPEFQLDSAYQGQEGLAQVRLAQEQKHPYAVAFVDVRMPPGWDGVETTARIWEQDPDIQIVICTAFSDYSWSEMLAKLGRSDRLVILKKPFDTIEVVQLASALSEKWRLARRARSIMGDLERRVAERTGELSRKVKELLASEEALIRFSTAMDATADAIYLVDRSSLTFVHVNAAACRMQSSSREELLALGPERVLGTSRAELARTYDAIIASGADSEPLEMLRSRKDGSQVWVELRRHAQRSGDRWTIVTLVRDVTERKQAQQSVLQEKDFIKEMLDALPGLFYLMDDRGRFIRWNREFELVSGYSSAEVSRLNLTDLFAGAEKELVTEKIKQVFATGEAIVEADYVAKHGTKTPYIFTGRRIQFDQKSHLIGMGIDITERRLADKRIRGLNRVYAVLSGINTLIVHVRNRKELFKEACRIAIEAGGFRMAMIAIVDRSAMQIVPVASAGMDEALLSTLKGRYAADKGASLGNSLAARAIWEKRAAVSNDLPSDSGIKHHRRFAEAGIRSIAILPLLVADKAVGVIALYAGETDFFHEDELKLLTELAGDIAFAMDHLKKARKLDRMTRVNAILSGINGAIVQMRDRKQLFQEVCRIAVEAGGLLYCWLCVVDETGEQLRAVGYAGPDDGFREMILDRLSLRDDAPNGYGISARSVREKHPIRVGDVTVSAYIRHKQPYADRGIKSTAAFPLLIADRAIGSFSLNAAEIDFFDDQEMNLLQEVARNIAFALEHIEKEEKVRRLTRVYAVLSGINALIVRARNRDELFREACLVAVAQGRFKMAWIGAVNRSAMKIEPVASAGSKPDYLAHIKNHFSLAEASPTDLTMTARAVLTKQAAFSNDTMNDPGIKFKEEHAESGTRSLASIPLLVADEAVGVLCLYAEEHDFFDKEELTLLTELARNIAFAIDHIGKQEQLDYFAYYDALTGLANRNLFLERVALYLRAAVKDGHKLALFFLDLERFRNINDSLGRTAGDALLKQVSEWLTQNVGDANLLARVGTDHFAIVLPEVKRAGDVGRLLDKRIRAMSNHAFRVVDTEIRLAVKVGVSLYPTDGTDADTLLRNAEVALKKAKASGDRHLFYTQTMTDAAAGKLSLEIQLRNALDKDEFILHYQPKITLDTGKLAGAEALIRWNDPDTGLVPPGRFIPILEETGLIHEVGRWALRKAIEQYLLWRAAGLPAVRIAVNVSPLQLRNRAFVAEVQQAVGVDPHAAAGLELEITESLIMEDVKLSIASLKAIRALGVYIAIDDFGTGFSSLSYLAKLPVDTLKIDRSFVADMSSGPDGLALVTTIINLAHSLKLKVVAEGVETEEQSHLLRLLHCDEMQGFLFSKPVPAEIFEAKYLALASGN